MNRLSSEKGFMEMLLQDKDAEYTFIGGHYKWPGLPSESAVYSSQLVEFLKTDRNAEAYIFLDDIGASEACSGTVCKAPQEILRNAAREDSEDSLWMDPLLDQLRQTRNLNEIQELLQKWVPTHILDDSQSTEQSLLDLEKYIYSTQRSSFSPLLLSLQSKIFHKNIILERSMNNLASRQLHKIKKKNIQSGLLIEKEEGITSYYSTYLNQPDKKRTLLRKEHTDDTGVRASNFCSILLSQLFYKVLRANKKKQKEKQVILYVIPCFDRGRLHESVYSFQSIYGPSFQKWFGIEEVTLMISFCFGNKMIHDVFELSSSDIRYSIQGSPRENLS